jgi:uncharacterized damage-inducible protein DinB
LLLDQLEGLSARQWNYKPSPEAWSIAQIAEHLVLTEELLQGRAKEALKSPRDAERMKGNAAADEKILKSVPDRSKKSTAPEALVPAGKFAGPAAAAAAFKERRDAILGYVRTTQDELRGHYLAGPREMMYDSYRFLLLMSAHTERHVEQIKEVKASEKYPKK